MDIPTHIGVRRKKATELVDVASGLGGVDSGDDGKDRRARGGIPSTGDKGTVLENSVRFVCELLDDVVDEFLG